MTEDARDEGGSPEDSPQDAAARDDAPGHDALQDDAPQPVIVARGITMRGPRGPVYGPIDLDVDPGGVTVLNCLAGEGRTALLMTLAGRMRPASGELQVLGSRDARQIFARAALAGVDELDPLPESVTVGEVLTEQLRWRAPWYRRIRRAGPQDLERLCAPVFGELPLPPLEHETDDLAELDALLLRIALANADRPALLVVDGLDALTSDRDRQVALDRLIELGREQTVVTASVNDVSGRAVRAQLSVPNVVRTELAAREGSR